MNYKSKYLKYKLKYLKAKQLYGGSDSSDELNKLFKKKTDLNPSGIPFEDSPDLKPSENPFEDSPTLSGVSNSTINTARKDVLKELKKYPNKEQKQENILRVEPGSEIDTYLPNFSNVLPDEDEDEDKVDKIKNGKKTNLIGVKKKIVKPKARKA